MSKEGKIFAAIAALCAAGLYFYLFTGRPSNTPPPAVTPVTSPTPPVSAPPPSTSTAPPEPATPPATHPPEPLIASRMLLFRHTAVDNNYGKLAYAKLADLTTLNFHPTLTCEAVHFAASRGICLSADRGVVTTYAATIFDAGLKSIATLPLEGVPSRTRVAPNGRFGAATVFVTGHSYASVDFSTATLLLDLLTGKSLGNLETFRITRDGQPFQAKDVNFWGVTFTADSKRFYCTLSSAGKHHLLEGDLANRSGVLIHENVECPSLSPDGTRIAYKKRSMVDNRIVWQLHVLDLATHTETPLAEKRNLDDQIEWLDNRNVLYALPAAESGASTHVWTAPADGSGTPRRFLPNAYSPAVVR